MLSNYSRMLFENSVFCSEAENLISNLGNERVLIYGCGAAFNELDKKFGIAEKVNAVAISDKKFEENPVDYKNIKAIAPCEILNYEFDKILITNENPDPIRRFLENDLSIDEGKIVSIYYNAGEKSLYEYIDNFNFEKYLKKLKKKLKDKTVIIYGAGQFFQVIRKFYDISGINIIGISDQKFRDHEENEEFLGYKVYAPSEIKNANPDYVLVATKFYVNIIESLYYDELKGTKIKIKAFVKKPFGVLLKEIWG